MIAGLTVAKLGGSHAFSPLLRPWIGAIERAAGSIVLVPGGGPFADAVRSAQREMGFDDRAADSMALLAMAQYGTALAGIGTCLALAETEQEIRALAASGRVPVWSPMRMVRAAPDVPATWDVTSDSLALWLARRLGADRVLLVKHRGATAESLPALVREGFLDSAFPGFAAAFAGRIFIAGPEDLDGAALESGRMPGRLVHAGQDA
jgi:aspartokinase-like uncharacterized kinase